MAFSIKQAALRTIELEKQSVAGLSKFIDDDFEAAIRAISACTGRLVLSGIGKSAIIAQKIAATLNSTGTASLFMHAADAIHGDLGMVQPDDIVMIISKSGESPEIKMLVPLLRGFGNLLAGMTGNPDSFLAQNSNFVLKTVVEQEACPNNLAPTTSTTSQLVMGDALAVCLMELRGFSQKDFAKFHPGGMLGKKLYLRVADLCVTNEKPQVLPAQSLREVIVEMTAKRLGLTAVVDASQTLVGIITDGDLRRMLEKSTEIERITAGDIMTPGPKTIGPDALAVDALDQMRSHKITQLVVTENGKYAGIIHLHNLVREGLI